MSLMVVGSVALDTIETPHARDENTLGGSATHFSLAASILTRVRLVGFVGTDFPPEHVEMLAKHNIDLAGLHTKEGKTFRWTGQYSEDMNVRETLHIELNVFGAYEPEVPAEYADSEFVFLANGSPVHQLQVVDAMTSAKFVAIDTMDHWIECNRKDLEALFKRVHAVVVNDSEARLLTGKDHLDAAEFIRDMGPEYVIVKRGEYGAVMVGGGETFIVPAYPVRDVRDPTGAGDSFAGGMMGYLADVGVVTPADMRRAIAYGTVIASFNVEDFGVRRTAALTRDEVEARLEEFRAMLAF